jgi:hypothetical protein
MWERAKRGSELFHGELRAHQRSDHGGGAETIIPPLLVAQLALLGGAQWRAGHSRGSNSSNLELVARWRRCARRSSWWSFGWRRGRRGECWGGEEGMGKLRGCPSALGGAPVRAPRWCTGGACDLCVVGHRAQAKMAIRLTIGVWHAEMDVDVLLNEPNVARCVFSKNIELCEVYHFVNWSLNWFGLDLKLHSPKVGYLEL